MKTFPRFIWALLGLLAIGAGLLSLGKRDLNANPSVLSLGPSGVSAFAELLRKAGYDVRIDKRSHPTFEDHEIGIAFRTLTPNPSSNDPLKEITDYAELRKQRTFQKDLLEEVQKGAKVFLMNVPHDFLGHSKILLDKKPAETSAVAGGKAPLKVRSVSEDTWTVPSAADSAFADEGDYSDTDLTEADTNVGLWYAGDSWIVHAHKFKKGLLVTAEASFLTNRFIDQEDDAEAALRLVRLLARPKDRVVFVEAAIGNVEDPGFIEAIGAWAIGAWRQLGVLVLVIIYTLGKRFGIPDESRTMQRGSRELVDGLSYTFLRGRQTRAAMSTMLERMDGELRAALRLPRGVDRSDLNAKLPASLQEARFRLEEAILAPQSPSNDVALSLIARARTEADTFIRERRFTRR